MRRLSLPYSESPRCLTCGYDVLNAIGPVVPSRWLRRRTWGRGHKYIHQTFPNICTWSSTQPLNEWRGLRNVWNAHPRAHGESIGRVLFIRIIRPLPCRRWIREFGFCHMEDGVAGMMGDIERWWQWICDDMVGWWSVHLGSFLEHYSWMLASETWELAFWQLSWTIGMLEADWLSSQWLYWYSNFH